MPAPMAEMTVNCNDRPGGFKRFSRGFLTLVMCVGAMACSSSSPAANGESEPAPPIESSSPEIQGQFDEAYEFFEQGRWERALEEFRLLQAEHAGDATASLAELYIARALLADIDAHFGADDGEPLVAVEREVFSLLEPLAGSDTVDERIRFAAQSYLATAHALEGNVDDAVDALRDYPSASLSPAVLPRDRRWMWPLVAEGLAASDRHGEAVVAWARLHSLLQQRAGEEERPERAGDAAPDQWLDALELPAKADLAVARAFQAEPHLGDEELHSFLNHEYALVRAVAAWTMIRDELTRSPGPAQVEVLQELFNDVSSDFLDIGAADRASELSVAIAAVAGPDRLVIGALVPLTGPNRAVGYRALSGMLLAQRAFHDAGQPAITLVIEDSHPDVTTGYERLVDEGVLAVVGPLQTANTRQLLEPAKQSGVPLLALAADRIGAAAQPADAGETADDEESHGERQPVELDEDRVAPVFRNFVDAVAEARAAASLSFERFGDRRAAVVYPELGYGRVMAGAFVDEFRRQGGEVVTEISYDRDRTDFVELAKNVAAASPDAIFLPDTGAKVAEISAFFAQEDIWGVSPAESASHDRRNYVHYLGTSLWQDPIVLHQAATYLEGALIPAWYSSEFDDTETRQLARGYEAIYGAEADHFVAFSYDSVVRLRNYLLDRGIPDAEGIEKALREPQWQRGATGRHAFGDDGEPRRELRFLTVEDGHWAVFDDTVITPLEGRPEADARLKKQQEELESIDENAVDDIDTERTDDL